MRRRMHAAIAFAISVAAIVPACSGGGGGGGGGGGDQKLSGAVRIDGSSTVFPVTEAVAEEFRAVQPGVQVTVGVSGTGGGFKKFVVGETDINDASRPIDGKETASAKEHGIEFVELPIAYDGLTVVVHPSNTFVDKLSVAELNAIWKPESVVKTWQDVRPEWPATELHLYGPGHDSGTFDYFTEAVNGKSKVCRSDYTASEDDNVLVQGVSGDEGSLGFFGFAYYIENKDRLRAVPIDNGQGPITPSIESIRDGTYAPLSRPIFIYVSKTAASRPEVAAFVGFYLESGATLVTEVGYVPLPNDVLAQVQARWTGRVSGTLFADGQHGLPLAQRLAAKTS